MSSEILPLIDFSKVKKKRKVEAENADEQDLEEIRRCPTCGHSLDINASGLCPYCNQTIDMSEYDYIVTKIDNI